MGFPFTAYLASLARDEDTHKAYNRVNGNTLDFNAIHDETRIFAQ
jgi:hypothetical protein